MTTGSQASPVFPGLDAGIQRARPIALALLATLALAVLSVALARFDGWSRVPASVLDGAEPRSASLSVNVKPAPLAGGARENVDILSTLIARKYRVSPRVARELIGTAYREGARLGVDPLL